MKKLFTINTGSKMYGTDHPESDTDVKHILLPDLDDLLLGKKLATVEVKTNDKLNTKNTKDDVDEKFVPVQEFARLFLNGDTESMEIAFAAAGRHAGQTYYDENERPVNANLFFPFVEELRTNFLTRDIRSLVSYVINQAGLYSLKGERLNACKAVQSGLETCRKISAPAMLTFKLGELADTKPDPFGQILKDFPDYFTRGDYDIGQDRRAPCFRLLGKTLPFTNSLEKTLEVVNALVDRYGARAAAAAETNVDWKATMHAMRIVDEGLMLLREGKLEFPLEKGHVERLWQIRRGEVDYASIKEEFNLKVDLLTELEKTSHLPNRTDEMKAKFERWLAAWMRRFYEIN